MPIIWLNRQMIVNRIKNKFVDNKKKTDKRTDTEEEIETELREKW